MNRRLSTGRALTLLLIVLVFTLGGFGVIVWVALRAMQGG